MKCWFFINNGTVSLYVGLKFWKYVNTMETEKLSPFFFFWGLHELSPSLSFLPPWPLHVQVVCLTHMMVTKYRGCLPFRQR